MKKFRTSLKGYNKTDVNNFIAEVVREYESILEKLKNSIKNRQSFVSM